MHESCRVANHVEKPPGGWTTFEREFVVTVEDGCSFFFDSLAGPEDRGVDSCVIEPNRRVGVHAHLNDLQFSLSDENDLVDDVSELPWQVEKAGLL